MGRCNLCSARYPDKRAFCPSCGARQSVVPEVGVLSRIRGTLTSIFHGSEYCPAWLDAEMTEVAYVPPASGQELWTIRRLTAIIDRIRAAAPGEKPGQFFDYFLRRWRGDRCVSLVKMGYWENTDKLRREDPSAYQTVIAGDEGATLQSLLSDWRASSFHRGNLSARDVENPNFVRQHCELAINDFREALRYDPSDAELYLGRAEALHKLGRTERARSDFDAALGILTRAVEAQPADEHSFTARAFTWARLGKRKNALADLKQALTLVPSENESRRKNITAEIESLKGEPSDWWSARAWPPL